MAGAGTVAGVGLGLTGVAGGSVVSALGGVTGRTGITGGGRGVTGGGTVTFGRNLGMGAGSGGVGFANAFVDPVVCNTCFIHVPWDTVLSLKPSSMHFFRA